jgi:hypothetical protein
MPKIAEIDDTPNPNAVKFTLHEPLTWGVSHSYENAEQASGDALASALFAIEHVTNVFYVDRWLTVTQDGEADWPELVRLIAVPLRAAPGSRCTVGSSGLCSTHVDRRSRCSRPGAPRCDQRPAGTHRSARHFRAMAETCMWSACPATV